MVANNGAAINPPHAGLSPAASLKTDLRYYQRRRYTYTCHIPEQRRNPDRRILDEFLKAAKDG